MNSNKLIKTGIGYDVHRLSEGSKLIIGGVEIKFNKGSVGHSDGDALIHSIVDALLGAASIGDIGQYFSSDNKEWKNVKSEVFLKFSTKKIRSIGYEINHIDTNIIIQKPKMFSYRTKIIENLSQIMEIKESQVSVKAKTADFLGSIGEGSGWACQAIATLYKK
tara:strand:- start:177 stop:668 length:492 start_codon:yes stop_codon:yes gene_type:complete